MILNITQAGEINTALSTAGLKAKHISGDNFMKVINLKSKLKKALNDCGDQERAVAAELGFLIGDQVVFSNNDEARDYHERVGPIRKAFTFEYEMNFIPEGEIREYVKEQDTNIASIICEYLLKT